jgi:hypothetical protein
MLFCINQDPIGRPVHAYIPSDSITGTTPVYIPNYYYFVDPDTPPFDIAHTENKLWLYHPSTTGTIDIYEWNIELNPWSASYVGIKTILLPIGYMFSSGLVAKDDTTLIGACHYNTEYPPNSIVIEINLVSETYVEKFDILGKITGDFILTTNNRLIVSHHTSCNHYITQYLYTGNIGYNEVEIMLSSLMSGEFIPSDITTPNAYGLYEYDGDIYLVQNNYSSSNIYKIDKTYPFNLTQIVNEIKEKFYNYNLSIYGASNLLNESTEIFEITYAVGDEAFGGIIAYIYQSGDIGYVSGEQHGIIAHKYDLDSNVWGCSGTEIGTGVELGDGYINTASIVYLCNDTTFAAKDCANFTTNCYYDWSLPSVSELSKLYLNRALIGNFTTNIYWSSSESNGVPDPALYAYGCDFGAGGSSYTMIKTGSYLIRPIRYF